MPVSHRFEFVLNALTAVAVRVVQLLLWMSLSVTSVHAELILQDDLGNAVHLPAPPQRIVSLAPHITELLFEIGLGDRLVATVDYSDYPSAARSLPRIGDAGRIDHERLLAYAPDLVIAWGSGTPLREQQSIRRLGMPLYLSEPRRLADIATQMLRLGELAGDPVPARVAAERYTQSLHALRTRFADLPRRSVFYQLALQPLLTVNQQHIIHDVLALCGAENPFAALPELTPRLDVEAVAMAQPSVVIHALYPGETIAMTRQFWTRAGLPATTRYIGVPGDHIHRQTPRILLGVEQICTALRED